MVLNEKADIIFAAFIEVLLCTSEGIEVFYFHDVLEVMGKRWAVFCYTGTAQACFHQRGSVMKGF